MYPSKTVYFSKMESMGNDFVIFDGLRQSIPALSTQSIVHLGHRRFGVGFDQLLILEPPLAPEHDFRLKIYNADGSEARQCGNGARCTVQFAYEHGLCPKRMLLIETLSGPIQGVATPDGMIDVCLGTPKAYEALPNLWDNAPMAYFVDLGNPHCVILQQTIDENLLATWGERLQQHPRFPDGINLTFLHHIDAQRLKVRTFERGVGLTPSCGSGASAAAIVAIRELAAQPVLSVEAGCGHLTIRWDQEHERVHLIGAVTTVFEGSLELKVHPNEPPVSEFCDQ
ncbi:MAG: diaminopimelate epimerase [Pseudomonadota bacterium]